jgi:hypothetical protein
VVMSSKTVAEKRFDEVPRRMVQSKPLSRSEISVRIPAERRTARIKK